MPERRRERSDALKPGMDPLPARTHCALPSGAGDRFHLARILATAADVSRPRGLRPCDNGVVHGVGANAIGEQGFDRARLRELCERYGLSELAVFGSRARGDAHRISRIWQPSAILGLTMPDRTAPPRRTDQRGRPDARLLRRRLARSMNGTGVPSMSMVTRAS